MSDVETPLRLKRGESEDPKGDKLRAAIKITRFDPPKVNHVVHTRVVKVEQRSAKTYLRGFGDTAEFVESNLGWYIHFEGSYESLNFGMEQPPFKRGDEIKITFEKVDPCPPSQTINPTT